MIWPFSRSTSISGKILAGLCESDLVSDLEGLRLILLLSLTTDSATDSESEEEDSSFLSCKRACLAADTSLRKTVLTLIRMRGKKVCVKRLRKNQTRKNLP